MATLAELEDALKNADAAGDADAARALADEIVRMQSAGARVEEQGPPQPEVPPATALDRVQATTSGINSGLANTLGLPIDTGLNALDVGKGLAGYAYLLKNGYSPLLTPPKVEKKQYTRADLPIQLGDNIPAFIKPTARRGVLGSSENLKAGLNAVGVDTAAVRPDDKASRYLNFAGNLGAGAYFGGIYNRLGIPTGLPARPGATGAPPVGGNPAGAPPPAGSAPPVGGPLEGAPPPGGPLPIPAGAPGGPAAIPAIGLNATERATLAAGERLGLRVTPGVRAGSPQLRQIEARLESLPATSGPFSEIKASNARVIQREFLRAIGEQGNQVSAAALNRAATRIGSAFDDAAASTRVAYDNELETALSNIGARAANELTEAELPIIQRQLNGILNRAAGNGDAIDGPAFQNIFSAAGRLQRNGTGVIRDVSGDIRDALQDVLIRSSGPRVAEQLRNARTQYRILRTAENSGAIDVGSGSIKAGQLANAIRRNDNPGYLRGLNDTGLYDALRFAGTRSFGPIVGDSGTATRLGGFPDTLYRAATNVGGNVATRAYLNTPGPVLNSGVNAANATRDLVRDMLGIPRNQPIPAIIGLDAVDEDLRKGLYQ